MRRPRWLRVTLTRIKRAWAALEDWANGVRRVRIPIEVVHTTMAAENERVRALRQKIAGWRSWAADHCGRAFRAPPYDAPPGWFWKRDRAGDRWRLYRERP